MKERFKTIIRPFGLKESDREKVINRVKDGDESLDIKEFQSNPSVYVAWFCFLLFYLNFPLSPLWVAIFSLALAKTVSAAAIYFDHVSIKQAVHIEAVQEAAEKEAMVLEKEMQEKRELEIKELEKELKTKQEKEASELLQKESLAREKSALTEKLKNDEAFRIQKAKESSEKEAKEIKERRSLKRKDAARIKKLKRDKSELVEKIHSAFILISNTYFDQFQREIILPKIQWKSRHGAKTKIFKPKPQIEDFMALKEHIFPRGVELKTAILKFNLYPNPSVKINYPIAFKSNTFSRYTARRPFQRYSSESEFIREFEKLTANTPYSTEVMSNKEWNSIIDQLDIKAKEIEAGHHSRLKTYKETVGKRLSRFHIEGKKTWSDNNNQFLKAGLKPDDISADKVRDFCYRLCDCLISLPKWFPESKHFFWDEESNILIIDIELPYLNDKIHKDRKLINSTKVVEATKKESAQFREDILIYYPICLAYLFSKNNIGNWIKLICVNGYVNYAEPSTGNPTSSNIMTMTAKPEDLEVLDIKKIEPLACFTKFRGVSAANLADLVPVEPIIKFDIEESRFIAGKDVTASIVGNNLALMEWQDFEYLVRHVFEQEFQSSGSEVKVTQSSRDRGVDAVIFDPDPIRGGKIVVQAKRYSHTVDVSAVRDLYGTLLNEGANSGILITTSNFGADSFDFAKDKPLKLLNGSNLLHLLEKHGHKAHIDLDEAKKKLAADRRNSKE